MKGRVLAMMALVAVVGPLCVPAHAIPAFARRYGVECHFCHDGFPKLNSMGQGFKQRGFRMENEDGFEALKWIASVPASVRPQVNRFLIQDSEDSTSGFVKGISAGNLGPRLSYWIDDGVLITEGDDNVTHTRIDNGWGRLEILRGGRLYLKGGRFELDLPFTQARTPHLFSYDIYFANTGNETDGIGNHQDGAEIGGRLPGDAQWSAAVVKGHDPSGADAANPDAGKFEANLFLRVTKRLERNRIGAFAYIGRNSLRSRPGPTFQDDLLRIGIDGSVWLRRLNLYGVFMYGRNSDSLPAALRASGSGESLDFSGGFLQGDYRLRDNLLLNLRVNMVSAPPGRTNGPHETLTSLFPGAQLYLWEHFKLSAEYGFQNRDRSDFGALQAEFAF